MINREGFFKKIRESLFGGSLSTLQADIIEAILNECEKQEVIDYRQIAYCLATTYHECYNWNLSYKGRMIQLKEMGSPTYLKAKKYYPYYGRGPSHLTWPGNYKKEGARLGLDLLKNPDLMMDINIGANSHVYCMKHGSYTTHKLSDYIHDTDCDFIGARRIINGSDQASLIAGYADKFADALEAASM